MSHSAHQSHLAPQQQRTLESIQAALRHAGKTVDRARRRAVLQAAEAGLNEIIPVLAIGQGFEHELTELLAALAKLDGDLAWQHWYRHRDAMDFTMQASTLIEIVPHLQSAQVVAAALELARDFPIEPLRPALVAAIADTRGADECARLYDEARQIAADIADPSLRAAGTAYLLSYLPRSERQALAERTLADLAAADLPDHLREPLQAQINRALAAGERGE